MKPRIVFLDVDPEDQPLIHAHFPDADCKPASRSPGETIAACAGYDIVSTFITTAFPREVIASLPDLKLLCTRSVGYDHIDIQACSERRIAVTNVPDYGSHVIAEHVFALLLSQVRHIDEGNRRVAKGQFDYHGLRGMSLNSKTLGIVGTGKIGRKVARIAHGFGMRILAVDICRIQEITEQYGVEYVDLPRLLAESDIITLHAPSLPDTRHMINEATIAQMKHGVIIVNTARGSLIDTDALIAGLDNGKIHLALLDVLEHEANVKEDNRLVHHARVITTPHIAFYADDSVRTMYTDCIESIEQWLRGERPAHTAQPVHVVCDLPGAKF